MNSPIPWLGGKSRLADKIIKRIPSHERYAEVFTGAGWVFFRKPQTRLESLNDINGDLIAFYRVLQNHLEEFCRQFKWLLTSRELFDDFRSQQEARGLTDIQRASRFYYTQRLAFAGRRDGVFGVDKSSPPRVNLVRMEEELSRVHLRLANVIIEHLPWEDYLARYDDKGTFFYLDPPYWGCEDDYGVDLFNREDFTAMAARLAKIDGSFLLSINDVPEIRELFASFRIEEVSTLYTANKDANRHVRELIITNFAPTNNLIGLCL